MTEGQFTHPKPPELEKTEGRETPDEAAEVDEFELKDDEVYLAERTQLIKRRDELGDIFDKGRVALAGGAIAISATVMKDLAPGAEGSTKGLLVWSWMFLTASLICSLLCVYLAGLSHERQRRILDDDRRVGDGRTRVLKTGRTNGYNTWLGWLNPASVVLLMVGVVLMGATFRDAFSGKAPDETAANMKPVEAKSNMSDKNKTTKDIKPSGDGNKSFGASDRPVTPSKPSNQGSSGGGSGDKKK